MSDIIGLAVDAVASTTELAGIRATLRATLGFLPREPQPGQWVWYGRYMPLAAALVAQLEKISAAHPDRVFWSDHDLDLGCAEFAQFVLRGGKVEHIAVVAECYELQRGDDGKVHARRVDEPPDLACWTPYFLGCHIDSGRFDRTRICLLPSERPRCCPDTQGNRGRAGWVACACAERSC